MGKQMSKAKWGGGRGTRTRRSSITPQPTVVTPPEDAPRLGLQSTESFMLTLKLQRDELMVYRNRVGEALQKEEDIVKGLLKKGQMERAKLLMKKKRFQENILHETEKKLNSTSVLPRSRNEVDEIISRNSEALKRLHILLSLEKVDEILKETYEGAEKQFEVDNLLQLATVVEREWLEKDAEGEIKKLINALNVTENQRESDEFPLPPSNETEKDSVNELEALVNEKLIREKKASEQMEASVVSEESEEGASIDQVSSERTEEPEESSSAPVDIGIDEAANEESPSTQSLRRQVPLTLNLQSSEIASLLPDVPSDPIDTNNEEISMMETQQALKAEMTRLAEADNV